MTEEEFHRGRLMAWDTPDSDHYTIEKLAEVNSEYAAWLNKVFRANEAQEAAQPSEEPAPGAADQRDEPPGHATPKAT